MNTWVWMHWLAFALLTSAVLMNMNQSTCFYLEWKRPQERQTEDILLGRQKVFLKSHGKNVNE